jgi:two-component system OmpR family sensor kinase
LEQLSLALNRMITRLREAFEQNQRFLADASHELRTPLTSIRGYAELLRKGAFDTEDDRRRAAERIEGEAARMTLLVDDLLLLARLDQGRPLARDAVDLARVVADAVDAVRITDPDRPVTLDTGGPVVVQGDAARLRQIVDNLLQNAVVHTPARTAVRVAVRAIGPDAVVRVADEGPGLEPEQMAQVFERFYRGSEARTGEGTGLGLSIVAALAEAHGGRTGVQSTPGEGSVFSVEIPTAPPPAPTSPPAGETTDRAATEAEPPADPDGGDEHLAPSVRR